MNKKSERFQFYNFKNYLLIKRDGFDLLVINNVSGQENPGQILSLVKQMIKKGDSPKRISWRGLVKKYSVGNRYQFVNNDNENESLDYLSPVC